MFLAVRFSETKCVWKCMVPQCYFPLLGLLKAVSDPERTLLKTDGAAFPARSNGRDKDIQNTQYNIIYTFVFQLPQYKALNLCKMYMFELTKHKPNLN